MKTLRVMVFLYLAVLLCAPNGVFAAQSYDTISASFFIDENDSLQTVSLSAYQLESIGKQIASPDQTLLVGNTFSDQKAVDLPGVPKTLYMAICGFLCITIVRDRRSWLAVLAGAMWLCQAGIHALPELGHKLCSNKTVSAYRLTKSAEAPLVFFDDAIIGNSKITSYIGLLRKLDAIPTLSERTVNRSDWFTHDSINTQAIVNMGNGFIEAVVCSVRPAEDFAVFSPAFVFSNLSRGPPGRFLESA